MATIDLGHAPARHDERDAYKERLSNQPLMLVLQYLGSLKLTITLFALSMVLVLAGTIAQESLNMLQVKQRYFTSWVAQLHIADVIPFYDVEWLTWWVPFPGGALIGTLLLLNLVAAKVTRFHARATGAKLVGGLGLLALGFALMLLVIFSSSNAEGLQGEPPFSYNALWTGICGAVAAAWVYLVGSTIMIGKGPWRVGAGIAAVLFGILLILMLTGAATLSESGLRIMWQLLKGLGVAAVLMAGCWLIFGKQGGNVLLHLGVALLMIGQFAYGDRQLEQQLSLVEGDVSNTLINQDKIELTFIQSHDGKQTITGIPASRLTAVEGTDKTISDPKLPFDVRVLEYYPNSDLTEASEETPATTGIGKRFSVTELPPEGGTTSEINVASAYVQLIDKESGEPLGTHLVSQYINDTSALFAGGAEEEYDEVTAGDETYRMGLRFHRVPKPYWVKLKDVTRLNYSGSSTPRDYASVIRLVDTETGEDRQERIWMNNPLRYRGETFYQSNYTKLPGGKELTGLQVVQNTGWLIPYLACSITGLGMLVHFSGTLQRYLGRRERERKKLKGGQPRIRYGLLSLPLAIIIVATLMSLVPWSAVMNGMRPERRDEQFDFYQAGEIPVQYGGRLMPLDAYARQTLKAISKKESLPLENAPRELIARIQGKEQLSASQLEEAREGKISAMQWLMELASETSEIYDLEMIRIDAGEVLSELGLQRRESKLYTLNEIQDANARLRQITETASEKDESQRSFKEEKVLELSRRMFLVDVAANAMRWPTPRNIPDDLFPESFSEAQKQAFAFRELQSRMQAVENADAPGLVPPDMSELTEEEARTSQVRWQPFSSAFFNATIAQARNPDSPAPLLTFGNMIRGYQAHDASAFNSAVDEHLADVKSRDPVGYRPAIIGVERWMESQWPTGTAMILYLFALLLGLICLLVDLPQLRYGTWMLLIATLVLHTVVIVLRVMITQRPPVINLYSSAVFIGWACVLYGLVIEHLGRRGIGNVVAAAAGAITLLVAYGLNLNTGDTMGVLQAVLDTQFWLGTHVITVTLGYSATFAAGILGIAYLAAGWSQSREGTRSDIYRMMYGVTCFAILFSFIGTVLGGLWADDSWGRFWGWDPKENGALLIVIWNALMLHARWDRMVGPRGFSMLAIGGNIVTAWSWFGTNQLGIGLHSYGFTSGTLMWLSIFLVSQLGLIAGAWLYWPEKREAEGSVR